VHCAEDRLPYEHIIIIRKEIRMRARVLVCAACLVVGFTAAAQDCSRRLYVELLDDPNGRLVRLTEDYAFVDAKGKKWDAPKGSTVDGASIPRVFWTLIGGPLEGKYRNASVVHDVACDRKTSKWRDVHRMFYDAMRCSGVDEAKAKTMYWAVYQCGPRWDGDENSPRLLPCGDGPKMVAHTVRLLRALFLLRVTPETLDAVKGIIQEGSDRVDMSLDQLERIGPEWLDQQLKESPMQLAIDMREPAADDEDFIIRPKRDEIEVAREADDRGKMHTAAEFARREHAGDHMRADRADREREAKEPKSRDTKERPPRNQP
jgi:Protein of unknown function (DUF1353)